MEPHSKEEETASEETEAVPVKDDEGTEAPAAEVTESVDAATVSVLIPLYYVLTEVPLQDADAPKEAQASEEKVRVSVSFH